MPMWGGDVFPPALIWRPALPAVAQAAVLLLLAAMLVLQWRRLRRRFGVRRAWPIVAARGVVVVLLLLAFNDPACRRPAKGGVPRRLLVLLDRSDSMRVADDGAATREARAERLVAGLERRLPAGVEVTRWAFAGDVWSEPGPPPAAQPPGTDVGGALLAAAERAGKADVVWLLTDGGDEPPRPPRLPAGWLAVAAIGSDPSTWRDVAVAEVQAPAVVECGATFGIEAELLARGAADERFRAGLEKVAVTLSRERGAGEWEQVAAGTADLRQGRGRVAFETRCEEAGSRRFKVEAATVPGELSPLNNRRRFVVEARRETLDVLYFSRRLGADLKYLRRELSADPALTFTALFLAAGGRHTVQAGEGVDVAAIEHGGLPADAAALRRFDCLILGSFPAELWSVEEMRALLRYVEEGGGVIWLGGEESFEGGGYETSPLAPLIPWRMGGGAGDTLVRADCPVSIPPAAAGDAAVAGLREVMAQADGEGDGAPLTMAAVNRPGGPLLPGARVLLNAELPGGSVPLLVAQWYGRGRVYALASNAGWRWAATTGMPALFHRRLWRQLVRAAAGRSEGGRLLQVNWEGNVLRPAGRTTAEVRLTAPAETKLRATLADGGGVIPLPLAPGGEEGTWRVAVSFGRRGEYLFRLEALREGEVAETYEKRLAVEPPEDEGTRLECRLRDLARLAERQDGICHPEAEAERLIAALAERLRSDREAGQASLVSDGPWFLLAVLAALCVEWSLRRRLNLV